MSTAAIGRHETGRHRRGVQWTKAVRANWDGVARAQAAQLDLLEPSWLIFYGVAARRFYAIASWPVPEGLIVEAGTVGDLQKWMREAEDETNVRLRGRA